MATATCLLLAAVCCLQATSMPLSTQLSDEEEKVTRCIMEVLADSLAKPGPQRVSSTCLRILKEDERVISMLRHQHLLKELENLAHQGKSQHQEEGSDSSEEEELRKRSKDPSVPSSTKRDGETKRGIDSEGSKEHTKTKEFEKVEKVEVKEKEHGTSEEERGLENAKDLLEEEIDEEKRDALMKREQKRDGKMTRSDGATKRNAKKRFDSEDEDSSEEEEENRGYHGNNKGWYHEGWEERKRASNRRMAEDPSEEETSQFRSENKGMKLYNSKTHMQGFHGNEKRYLFHPEEGDYERERGYHHPVEGQLSRERHYHDGRPETHKEREEDKEREKELEEMEEREEHKAEERNIQEVEEELQRAAEKMQELHRG